MAAKLTPRQQLEAKAAFTYFFVYCLLYVFSHGLQFISHISLREALPGLIVNTTCITLAFIVYMKKRRGMQAAILPWILAFMTTSAPTINKFGYAKSIGWTFAVQSYNNSALICIFVTMMYLFFKPRLFVIFTVWAYLFYAVFLYVAFENGADFHMTTTGPDGKPWVSGVILTRELFTFFVYMLIAYISYRNIPVINEFDEKTTRQRDQIITQNDNQKRIGEKIKDKMRILFGRIDEQHNLIAGLNQRLESQAASFSEMSATIEELSGSAEQIAIRSTDQIGGNVKMEGIVKDFRDIQSQTQSNLGEALADIEAVAGMSNDADNQLKAVEKTVVSIKDQGARISDTVTMITDIADKINLLSLNAAIEAARAGDAGRGFAVVADEIGKLAFQTQESIKEIMKVLSMSAKNTAEGVQVIQLTAQMVREMISRMGSSSEKIKLLQESILIEDRYMKAIVQQMEMNITLAKEIGVGTDEQKTAALNTAQAIENLNEILYGMVDEMKRLSTAANEIYINSNELLTESDQS